MDGGLSGAPAQGRRLQYVRPIFSWVPETGRSLARWCAEGREKPKFTFVRPPRRRYRTPLSDRETGDAPVKMLRGLRRGVFFAPWQRPILRQPLPAKALSGEASLQAGEGGPAPRPGAVLAIPVAPTAPSRLKGRQRVSLRLCPEAAGLVTRFRARSAFTESRGIPKAAGTGIRLSAACRAY